MGLFLAGTVPVWGQIRHPPYGTVAQLGTCEADKPRLRYVTDALNSGDCGTGGGSVHALCKCEGGTWASMSTLGADPNTVPVLQTSHGFSLNQWVMYNGATDLWALLDVSSPATMADVDAAGIVTAVADANTFSVTFTGSVTYSHGQPTGALFATTASPGALTPSQPALGTIEWLIAVAVDSTTVIVLNREWSQL